MGAERRFGSSGFPRWEVWALIANAPSGPCAAALAYIQQLVIDFLTRSAVRASL